MFQLVLFQHPIIAKLQTTSQEQKKKKKKRKEKQAVLLCTLAKNILFTDLGIPFSELLEHVGVGPLVLFVMFLNLALAYGNLSTSRPVGGVDLQHLLKVCHGQAELVTQETRFRPAVQSLLVVLVELDHLTREHGTQAGRRGVTSAKRRPGRSRASSRCEAAVAEAHLVAVLHHLRQLVHAQVAQREVEVRGQQEVLNGVLLLRSGAVLHLQPRDQALVLDDSLVVPPHLIQG